MLARTARRFLDRHFISLHCISATKTFLIYKGSLTSFQDDYFYKEDGIAILASFNHVYNRQIFIDISTFIIIILKSGNTLKAEIVLVIILKIEISSLIPNKFTIPFILINQSSLFSLGLFCRSISERFNIFIFFSLVSSKTEFGTNLLLMTLHFLPLVLFNFCFCTVHTLS